MPSPDRASQSTEEGDATRYRLAEPLHMHSKDELPIVSGTQENREGIAEHLSSWLKKAVSHLDEPRINLALSDLKTISSTSGCKDATIIPSLRAISR